MFSGLECPPIALPNKTVALTYDDGPGPRTIEIAEFLNDRGIRATFFVVGMFVRANREIVAGVRQLGHVIANHTDTHQDLTTLVSKPDELIQEVFEANRAIQEFAGDAPLLLRAPGGAWSQKVAEVLNGSDELSKRYFGPVNWTIAHGDYEIGSPRPLDSSNPIYTFEECAKNYLQDIREKQSGVVLLHDWSADAGKRGDDLRKKNRTVELTKWLVPQLEDFTFALLDEVATRG